MNVYLNYIKPILDFMIALTAFLIFLPVFLLVSGLLWVSYRENPFFLQTRPGKNEKLFQIIKFKTMSNSRDDSGKLLPDAERLTEVGKLIRKTSLDEIPQLLNVIKGDMSLVGPRPLLPDYLDLFTEEERKRHRVKPGITGWAAVNGRNAISWKKKFQYDIWYVEHVSFFLDLKILLRTFTKVVKSEGINMDNVATTEPYNGKN